MSKYPIQINRNKMIYIIYPEKIIAYMGLGQWVSYNKYENWNRQGISQMITKLKNSTEEEYASPIEIMQLARDCNINGTSTSKPKDI